MATEKRLIEIPADGIIRVPIMHGDSAVGERRIDLSDIPIVDAVEVVRCKDCHFIIDRVDGTHGCYRHFMEDCKLDDFCSYGERKDNE